MSSDTVTSVCVLEDGGMLVAAEQVCRGSSPTSDEADDDRDRKMALLTNRSRMSRI